MPPLTSPFPTRRYAGEADLVAIAALINLCKTTDGLDHPIAVEELRDDFSSPDFDVDRDLLLWLDAQGKLCALAQCWCPTPVNVVDGFLGFSIRPDVRECGIEAEIFAWAETRLRDVAQTHQMPARLRCSTRDDQTARLDLFKRHGLTIDRYFYRMARSLAEFIPAPQFPVGFSVRPLQGEAEVEAWVELFNQSFVDHWNFHPLTVSDRLHWMRETDYRPELDLVAVAADGTFAAFCYCVIHSYDNKAMNRLEGWIADLGTRRGCRRIGLGRALLLTGLHTLKEQGMETALLGVDTQNPSGALMLYQSTGFHQRYRFVSHVKEIRT